MEDKFNMTVEENIFVAKRMIIDSIWKSANLEGIAVTYPETEDVFNGLTVNRMKVDDVIAINNLKRAWGFILDHTEYETDYNFILAINSIVGGDGLVTNAGYIRDFDVSIGGTDWTPDIPDEEVMKEEINEIMQYENVTERSIELMLYLMRKQAFYDGNKRTANMVANHLMISNGKGIISLPNKYHDEFRVLLVEFYEANDNKKIKKFVFDNSIDGISFNKETIKPIRNAKDIPLTKRKKSNDYER